MSPLYTCETCGNSSNLIAQDCSLCGSDTVVAGYKSEYPVKNDFKDNYYTVLERDYNA